MHEVPEKPGKRIRNLILMMSLKTDLVLSECIQKPRATVAARKRDVNSSPSTHGNPTLHHDPYIFARPVPESDWTSPKSLILVDTTLLCHTMSARDKKTTSGAKSMPSFRSPLHRKGRFGALVLKEGSEKLLCIRTSRIAQHTEAGGFLAKNCRGPWVISMVLLQSLGRAEGLESQRRRRSFQKLNSWLTCLSRCASNGCQCEAAQALEPCRA